MTQRRQPAVAVCGFPRSGSSMAMRMLHAGGIEPIDGSARVSYELPGLDRLGDFTVEQLTGRAVKILDGVLVPGFELPCHPAWRFVWMDRDYREQARSHIKFFGTILKLDIPSSATSKLARSMERDRPRALSILRGLGQVLTLRYENVLADPMQAAERIAEFVAPLDFCPAPAATVVHDRSAKCAPDLSFELTGA